MAAAFNDEGFKNEYVLSLKEALEGKKAAYAGIINEFNRKGDEEGELVGGNLALLAHLIGSGSDVKTKGRILFIEDVGEQLYNIDRMMRQLKRAGKLEKLNGLIFGIFTDTKDTERPFGQPLHEMLWDIIKEYDYPVCFDFPVSHSANNYALKVGVEHRLKVGEKKVLLEELD
jgi:muramoyltetrapeptide carboxypeptidase